MMSQSICTSASSNPSLSAQQIRGIELLLSEWQGMFSYPLGRTEGLPYLIALLKFIGRRPNLALCQTHAVRSIFAIRK